MMTKDNIGNNTTPLRGAKRPGIKSFMNILLLMKANMTWRGKASSLPCPLVREHNV